MINSIRNITFIILAVLSGFLSVNMFFQLGTTPLEKGVFVLVTIALEGLKIFTIINANVNWDEGKKVKGLTRYIAYAFIAIISIVASLGYTLTTINRVNESAKVSSNSALISSYEDQANYYKGLKKANEDTIAANVEALKTLLTEYNKTLPTLVEQKDKDKLTAAYFANKKKLEDANTALQVKNNDYFQKQIDNETKARDLKQKDVESTTFQQTSDSMFKLIGDRIGMTEQSTMFLILIIISIDIEVGIIFTAPHPTLDVKKKKKTKSKKDKVTRASKPEIEDEDDDEEDDDYDEDYDDKKQDLEREIPQATLDVIEHSMENLKKGIVSEPIDLSTRSLSPKAPEHIEPSVPWPRIPTVKENPPVAERPASIAEKKPEPIIEKPLPQKTVDPILENPVPQPERKLEPIVEKKEDESAFLKKQEPTLKRVLNDEDKEKLILNIEKVLDEVKNQSGKKFSIESLSMKTGISLEEIKKMFQYLSNLNLLNFDDTTKTWRFKLNRDEILNYLRNMSVIKY